MIRWRSVFGLVICTVVAALIAIAAGQAVNAGSNTAVAGNELAMVVTGSDNGKTTVRYAESGQGADLAQAHDTGDRANNQSKTAHQAHPASHEAYPADNESGLAITDIHHDEHAEHGENGEEHGEGGGVMAILAHHLTDSDSYDLPWGAVKLPVIPGDFSFLGPQYAGGLQVTKHMLGLVVAALLVIILVIPGMARTKKGEVPHGFGNFLEVLVVFIRDEVVIPNMGEKYGRKWLPFFLSAFFLVLFSNLLGMVPWGTTATGNINMTAGLAISMLLALFFAGFRAHGIKFIATFIPHGVPVFVIPLLFPIEIFGLFVKHFALCIRLFANMLAGHTVIGVFLALILMPAIALASVPGAVAISMLELFVAFLQAYIFVMLSSIFVGSAIHGH